MLNVSFSRSVLLVAAAALSVSAMAEDRAKRVDEVIRNAMKATKAPAIAVAIVDDGRVAFQRAYGFADLEFKIRATPDTRFEIGSVSKQFATAAVLSLVGQGKVSLDDPVSKHVPKLPDAWKAITVRQALSHTAGMRDYTGVRFNPRLDYNASDLLGMSTPFPLDFPSGTSWSYSNTGFVLAAMIVEAASGKSYSEYLSETVFSKAGMTDTLLADTQKVIERRARGYLPAKDGHYNADPMRRGAALGAGDVVSTLKDMTKWALALEKGSVLEPTLMAKAWEPTPLNNGRRVDYGLGWAVSRLAGQPVIEHGGATMGQTAQITRYPNQRLTVIVLTNIGGNGWTGFTHRIASIWEKDLVQTPWKPKPDPNRSRTIAVMQAWDALLQPTPDANKIDPEMLGNLATPRGKLMAGSLRSQFERSKSFRYVNEVPAGDDVWIHYIATFEKGKAPLQVLWSKDGKLVRFKMGQS